MKSGSSAEGGRSALSYRTNWPLGGVGGALFYLVGLAARAVGREPRTARLAE